MKVPIVALFLVFGLILCYARPPDEAPLRQKLRAVRLQSDALLQTDDRLPVKSSDGHSLQPPFESSGAFISHSVERRARQTTTINCTQLKDEDDINVIVETAGCLRKTHIGGRRATLDLSMIDVMNVGFFLSNKVDIDIPVVVDNSNLSMLSSGLSVLNNKQLKSVKLSELTQVGVLKVENNPQLDTLYFSELKNAQELNTDGNDLLSKATFPKLKTIDVLKLVKNPQLNILDFSKLENGKEIVISDSKVLSNLQFPSLTEAKDIDISNNIQLSSLELPKLENCTKFKLAGNSKLKTFDLPNLDRIGGLIVQNNAKLLMFHLSALETINSTNHPILIDGNGLVATLWLPNLKQISVSSGIYVKNNRLLTDIDMGTFQGKSDFDVSEFVIENNPELRSISLALVNSGDKLSNIKIRGNQNMEADALDRIRLICDGTCYIQRPGECIFPSPIVDLNELNGCQSVYGNLALSPSVRGFTASIIKSITGNVIIENTKLTSIDFLRQAKVTGNVVIKGNAEMCGSDGSHLNVFASVGGTSEIQAVACPTTTTTTTTTSTTSRTSKSTTTEAPTKDVTFKTNLMNSESVPV